MSSMNFKSETIRNILNKAEDKEIKIPQKFQRMYDWPKENAVRLIKDMITGTENGGNYHIGTFYMTPDNRLGDGGQRATAIMLASMALYNSIKENAKESEAKNFALKRLKKYILSKNNVPLIYRDRKFEQNTISLLFNGEKPDNLKYKTSSSELSRTYLALKRFWNKKLEENAPSILYDHWDRALGQTSVGVIECEDEKEMVKFFIKTNLIVKLKPFDMVRAILVENASKSENENNLNDLLKTMSEIESRGCELNMANRDYGKLLRISFISRLGTKDIPISKNIKSKNRKTGRPSFPATNTIVNIVDPDQKSHYTPIVVASDSNRFAKLYLEDMILLQEALDKVGDIYDLEKEDIEWLSQSMTPILAGYRKLKNKEISDENFRDIIKISIDIRRNRNLIESKTAENWTYALAYEINVLDKSVEDIIQYNTEKLMGLYPQEALV